MLFKCQYNKFFIYSNKRNISQIFKKSDDKTINSHIVKFDGRSIKTKNDHIEVLPNKFFKNNNNFIIYKTQTRIPRMFIFSIIFFGTSLYLFYYLFNNINDFTKTKFIFLLLNSIIFWKCLKSDIWRLSRYIKSIEITKDLSKLILNTFNNKSLTILPEDLNLIKKSYFYMFQYDFLKNISMMVAIKGEIHYIQLNNTFIPDKDILALVLRGYKLKFNQ